MTITRAHMEAILAAAEADIDHIPTVGVVTKPRGFSLDREQVDFLRDTLSGPDADAIMANEQEACLDTVQDWLTSAKMLKLDNVVRACETALAA